MSLLNSEKLKNKIHQIEKEINRLLEPATPPKLPFQICTDFENDRFHLETKDEEEFHILLFSRMANYFEKGFLLEGIQSTTASPQWFCSLHFSEGHLQVMEPSLEVNFPLPPPRPHLIFKSEVSSWKNLGKEWQSLIPTTPEWSALILEPTPGLQYLFFTRLAEPWLKLQTENAYKFIETAMTVLP